MQDYPWMRRLSVVFAATLGMWTQSSQAIDRPLAKSGQANAVIVVGSKSPAFYRWVAGELQSYVKRLSTAELPIVADDRLPAEKSLILLGGPQSNPLVAEAVRQHRADFTALKPDGFLLKTIDFRGRPALVVGGNDETGTMYAAYELLERLGIVFQLTGDIIPQPKPDLAMPALDLRVEPALKHRGMHCCHGIRWYMGLADFRQEIDQLAKLKMNVFQFYWGMGGPWTEFSYRGKPAEIIYPQESGYCAWAWNSGTAKSVEVGRECFPQDGYLGPPEFAKVRTQKEAYATARQFLREIIRYAHQRKVQVWLALGEITYVPPNLVPPTANKQLGFGPFYCGIALPHGDPAVLDIYEAAVQNMIENYPEADRYWVCTGSEAHIAAGDPQSQALVRDYTGARRLLPQKPVAEMDTDLADVAVADKLVRRIKARYPAAKLGAELIFRGGQLRALDSVLPKDVWLMNMVNWDRESAMSDFDNIQGRELVVWPRVTDDGGELNIQLNAMMYDQEETISGTVRHGVTGVLGQLNKARGAEASARYIADGAWDPAIRCRPFYQRYVGRLFGPAAQGMLVQAYLLLEENERTLGWHGRHDLFGTYHHGNHMGVGLRSVNYKEAKPKLDRPEVEKAIQAADGESKFWDGRARHCRQALELMRQARPNVLPGSRAELDYVIYKTANFITVFEELGAADEATAAFDRALLAMNAGDVAGARKQLEQTQAALDRANRLVHEAARQMIPYAHIPTEKHILYLFNDAMPSHQAMRRYLSEVIAFRITFLTAGAALAGDNWPAFRGPLGDGHSDCVGLPLRWSETENVVWKMPIHDHGWSSPVVWGDQVWLTTATTDGHQMFAVAVRRSDGKIIHDVKVFDTEKPEHIADCNSYASPTSAIEAGHVYVHYGTYGTACLDTASGKVLWTRRKLNCDHHEGPGASLLLWNDLLIFNVDGRDVQYVVALDKNTGKTVWKTNRALKLTNPDRNARKAYCTPIVVDVDGHRELIDPGAEAAMGYDPATGKELWRIYHGGWSIVPRPVFGAGLAFMVTDYEKPGLWAIRPGGSGDMTRSHVVWKNTKGMPSRPSILLIGERIYLVNSEGIAWCLAAKTGRPIWKERMGGKYSASPIFAEGRLYFFNEAGVTTVLEPGPKYRALATNKIDGEILASPAVAGKALFIRTKTHLYRIETQE